MLKEKLEIIVMGVDAMATIIYITSEITSFNISGKTLGIIIILTIAFFNFIYLFYLRKKKNEINNKNKEMLLCKNKSRCIWDAIFNEKGAFEFLGNYYRLPVSKHEFVFYAEYMPEPIDGAKEYDKTAIWQEYKKRVQFQRDMYDKQNPVS